MCSKTKCRNSTRQLRLGKGGEALKTAVSDHEQFFYKQPVDESHQQQTKQLQQRHQQEQPQIAGETTASKPGAGQEVRSASDGKSPSLIERSIERAFWEEKHRQHEVKTGLNKENNDDDD